MKFQVNKNEVNINYTVFLKRCGYGFIRDRRSGSESFARRLGRDHYPRFHIYVSDVGNLITFDIHIDHKKDASLGNSRHNSEYSGDLVSSEVERIGIELKKNQTIDKPGEVKNKKEKKSFWRKIFRV